MSKNLNAFGEEVITEANDTSVSDTNVSDTSTTDTSVTDTSVTDTSVMDTSASDIDSNELDPLLSDQANNTGASAESDSSSNESGEVDGGSRPKEPENASGISGESSLQDSPDNNSPAERNFRAIRETKERLEKELIAERNKLAQYKAKIGEEPEIEDDIEEVSDADNIKMLYAQTQALQAEMRLNKEYNDFDSVVTTTNVEILKSLYPKVAYELIQENDIYRKGKKAYDAMKKLNIFSEDPYINKKKKISNNSNKPVPTSSFKTGSSGLGAATAFAEDSAESRKRVFAEMRRLAKGN